MGIQTVKAMTFKLQKFPHLTPLTTNRRMRMSIFTFIAYKNKSLFTVWGPCSGEGKIPCDCPQCKHADKLEAEGKDWETEYQKALKNNPDGGEGE
jgi:hypothetical protein